MVHCSLLSPLCHSRERYDHNLARASLSPPHGKPWLPGYPRISLPFFSIRHTHTHTERKQKRKEISLKVPRFPRHFAFRFYLQLVSYRNDRTAGVYSSTGIQRFSFCVFRVTRILFFFFFVSYVYI